MKRKTKTKKRMNPEHGEVLIKT